MSDLIIERIMAILGMSLWLLFPLGMLIAVIKQQRHAQFPSWATGLGEEAGFAYYEGEDAKESDKRRERPEKERDSSTEESDEDENPLLHYLRGREKLHGERPPQAPHEH